MASSVKSRQATDKNETLNILEHWTRERLVSTILQLKEKIIAGLKRVGKLISVFPCPLLMLFIFLTAVTRCFPASRSKTQF